MHKHCDRRDIITYLDGDALVEKEERRRRRRRRRRGNGISGNWDGRILRLLICQITFIGDWSSLTNIFSEPF
jgi:hypothetical protein